MTIAQELAHFVSETTSVPQATREMAVSAVFDLMTAAIAGHESPGGRAARDAAQAIWGAGESAAWFSPVRLTITGAAFANSAAASMMDLDDGHRAAAGHPGACIIPAVLATAESCGADAERVLTAIALGYEIAIRIAAARDMDNLDTLVTGPWCGQGAAAAASWLRKLPPSKIAQAIAIAGSTAPNLAAVAYSRVMGNHVKEGIAWATATGLAAVDLAQAGFTGPIDLFDNDKFYDPLKLSRALGKSWLIDGIYFKPYSCCRWAHAALDALLELQTEGAVNLAAVQRIDVHTFSRVFRLNNDLAPANLEAAQYSVPFCLALMALRGVGAFLPLTEESLGDREVIALAKRVHLWVDPELDAMFSKAVPARLEVTMPNRRVTRTIIEPKGEATNPMTRNDLKAKFETATKDLIDSSLASSLISAIEKLDEGHAQPLFDVLANSPALGDSQQGSGLTVQNA
ncbi:MmgE/PrpD family protein [Pelagibius litoralis]|uniref:MmgE/PrpD family protein n=1 Tax=Pelagibius litoralis TaxID=374515 RepID=A0A967EXT5_9PROT|nr:MmgE/PrpD family protein [Pelagibius litoralis]NIA69392.1 MmgE/PrpD family protein [Pelagibius litoralis]